MDLVLKYRDKICNFSGIVLRDFNVPVVNNIELDIQVEPAIWFKSLLIESILIDCDLKNVFWQMKDSPTKRSIFDDSRLEECELFNSAINLISPSNKKPNKSDNMAKEIFRILHLHILPAIILQKEDLPTLNGILSDVENRISQINKQMVTKDTKIQETENILREKRETLLKTENFLNQDILMKCNEAFLAGILEDLNPDIKILNNKLVTLQNCVDMSREPVTDDGKIKQLEWRQKRDEVQSSILKFQSTREAINTNILVRRKKKKKPKKIVFNEAHESYMEIREQVRCDKSIIKTLFEEKVKTMSVREAIIQACNDLVTAGETTGCDLPKGGERISTDILGSSVKPKKWLTLNEKILSLLEKESSVVTQAYKNFCSTTTHRMKEFLDERALFDKRNADIPFFISMSEYALPPRKDKNKPSVNSYENVNQSDDDESPMIRFTQMLKGDVTQHIHEQCQLLVQQLSKRKGSEKSTCNEISMNKVWDFYEQHLYQQLMKPLSEVYEYVYKNKAEEIMLFISGKTLKDLDMQEPWLQREPNDKSKENKLTHCKVGSHCFQKSVSIVSMRNVGNYTVRQLCESSDPLQIDSDMKDDMYAEGVKMESSDCSSDTFKNVNKVLEYMIHSKTIMGKLKSITRANRMTSEYVYRMKSRYCGYYNDDNAINAEDMLAGTIYVLSKLDGNMFKQLYAHVHLVNDLLPPFMMGSIQDWSLTNFFCAFQCLSCQMASNAQ